MKETFTAKVVKTELSEDIRRTRYFLEYEKDGQTFEVCSDENSGSITEEGDSVLITLEDGRLTGTNIAESLRKRNRLMLAVLFVIIAVIIGLIALFLIIDNIVFRIVLGVVVVTAVIILNVL